MFLKENLRFKLLSFMLAFSSLLMFAVIPTSAAELKTVDYVVSKNLEESGAYVSDVIGDVEGSDLTLAQMKELLANPEKANYIGINTFEGTSSLIPTPGATGVSESMWVGTINMKFGEGNAKKLPMSHSSVYRNNEFRYKAFYMSHTSSDHSIFSGKDRVTLPSDGSGDGKVHTLTFSNITGSTELETLETVGMVSKNWNASGTPDNLFVSGDMKMTAYFKNYDGEDTRTKVLDSVMADGKETNYAFWAFTAGEGEYIDKIEIQVSWGEWPQIDDIAFVTRARPRPASYINSVRISGPAEIEAPPYGTKTSYSYSAEVLDQYEEVMADEPVTLTLSENSMTELVDGKITIGTVDDAPEKLIFTATSVNDPAKTTTLEVPVKNEPYFKASMVPKLGTENYTREEFIADLEATKTNPDLDMAIVNYDNEEEVISGGTISVPLNKAKDKRFKLVSTTGSVGKMKLDAEGKHSSGRHVGAVSGSNLRMLVPEASGGNKYNFGTDELDGMRVTALAFVHVGYEDITVNNGFEIITTYSNGETESFGVNIGREDYGKNNTFYGIKAPAGHYITVLEIKLPQSRWSALDDFAFILKKPDTITLDREYEKFLFSTFCDQDMKNITEDIAIPLVTEEGATVTWETNQPTVFNTATGAITIPDISDYSNVKIVATLTYGALSKSRSFDLYVPSKLDTDLSKIDLPEKVDDDIDLPTVGEIYGSEIVWSSDKESLITASGKVKRPEGKDKYVVLTATLTSPSGTISKEFGVTVKGTDRDSSSGGGGGGGSSSGGGVILSGGSSTAASAPKVPVATKPAVSSTFKDVEVNHWAHDSIIALYKKGIINGMGEGSFEPNGTVTREQYLSMLVRAFGFKAEAGETAYSDVRGDSWYAETIKIATALGISGGYADGTFGVGKEITREEMAVMAYRAAIAAGVDFGENESQADFSDAEDISHFAFDAVSLLNKKGIINGVSKNEFSPKTTTTRAQAAVIITRLLEVDYAKE